MYLLGNLSHYICLITHCLKMLIFEAFPGSLCLQEKLRLYSAVLNAIPFLHRRLMNSSLSELSRTRQLKTSDSLQPISKESVLPAVLPSFHRIFLFSTELCMYSPFQTNRALRVVPFLEKLVYNNNF